MIKTETYRDGRSIAIVDTETESKYVVDYRIRTETEGCIFLGYPKDNNILDEESYLYLIDMLYKEYLNKNIIFRSTREKDTVHSLISKHRDIV